MTDKDLKKRINEYIDCLEANKPPKEAIIKDVQFPEKADRIPFRRNRLIYACSAIALMMVVALSIILPMVFTGAPDEKHYYHHNEIELIQVESIQGLFSYLSLKIINTDIQYSQSEFYNMSTISEPKKNIGSRLWYFLDDIICEADIYITHGGNFIDSLEDYNSLSENIESKGMSIDYSVEEFNRKYIYSMSLNEVDVRYCIKITCLIELNITDVLEFILA